MCKEINQNDKSDNALGAKRIENVDIQTVKK